MCAADRNDGTAQGGQIQTGHNQIAPENFGRKARVPGKRGNHRDMFCLNQGHCAFSGPGVIAVQPIKREPDLVQRDKIGKPRGAHADPIQTSVLRMAGHQVFKIDHSVVSTISNSRSDASRA